MNSTPARRCPSPTDRPIEMGPALAISYSQDQNCGSPNGAILGAYIVGELYLGTIIGSIQGRLSLAHLKALNEGFNMHICCVVVDPKWLCVGAARRPAGPACEAQCVPH